MTQNRIAGLRLPSPKPETLALLKVSGNPINGLGGRRYAGHHLSSRIRLNIPTETFRLRHVRVLGECPGAAPAFMAAYNHPNLIQVASERIVATAEEQTGDTTGFAVSLEADAIGIAPMDPLYGELLCDTWARYR